MTLLILNAGSSSLRVQLIDPKSWKRRFKGHVDGIGLPSCRLRGDIEKKVRAKNHTEALTLMLQALQETGILKNLDQIQGVGHRVVHGGETYTAPTRITPTVLKALEKLSSLAPLHNPANLQGIRACLKVLPKTPNIAVFDTGFHATLPEHAYLYGLPYALYKKRGIRRYGFHGTSHHYVSQQAIAWLKAQGRPHARLITCHMGNGVSLTAVKNGKSIDTSMGFTPLEGVPMGARSGSFDPAILLHLLEQGMTPKALDQLIEHESGLKGLSGISSDVRPLRDIYFKPRHPKHRAVERAFNVYAYQITKTIGSYAAALGGLDAIVFTAGIGENAWYLREKIITPLNFLGAKLDKAKNRRMAEGHTGPLHTHDSTIALLVISTNEERQIAQETQTLLKKLR